MFDRDKTNNATVFLSVNEMFSFRELKQPRRRRQWKRQEQQEEDNLRSLKLYHLLFDFCSGAQIEKSVVGEFFWSLILNNCNRIQK